MPLPIGSRFSDGFAPSAWLLTGAALALHVVVALVTPYGIHRDEFLYLSLGAHLRFWAMDVPPGIGVFANVARAVFGDTLFAVRFWPAVGHAALVAMAALAASWLGGSKKAQTLAALARFLSPLYLRAGTLFQPVVFDQVWWTAGLLALIHIGQTGRRRGWIALGIVCGLGLLTKLSILFFGVAVLVGLAVSPQRRVLLTPAPYLAALTAFILGSATFVGQIKLGFPVFGQMAALREAQLERVTAGAFLGGQFEMLGPAAVLALAGLLFLLHSRETRAARAAGWTCLAAFVLMLVTHGKAYYIGPIYPVLFGAGAVALERLPRRAARPSYAVLLVLVAAFGALTFPMGVPVLPPAQMARYAARFEGSTKTNTGETLPLPQDYADMLGWQAQVKTVAEVYHALPPAERDAAIVLARNYGEAGALDFYGPRYGLPRVVCAHTSFWFFGPGEKPGTVAVSLGLTPEQLSRFYEQFEVMQTVDEPWVVPEEKNVPIAVARAPRQPIEAVWPSLAGIY